MTDSRMTINSGLAFISGAAACERNVVKLDPLSFADGTFWAYKSAAGLGDFEPNGNASIEFARGWNAQAKKLGA